MVEAEGDLVDRQRVAVENLGLVEASGVLVQDAQVVLGAGGVKVVRPQAVLGDDQASRAGPLPPCGGMATEGVAGPRGSD